jgi:hypothetical protein
MSPAMVAGADNGTVAAEVTVAAAEAPCIIVGPNISYGTLEFSRPDVPASNRNANLAYTNCSPQSQRIYARGTPAVSTSSGATWQLISVTPCAELNHYWHSVVRENSSVVPLTLEDQLIDDVAPAGAEQLHPTNLAMPCRGSAGAGETMTFSIILTASF